MPNQITVTETIAAPPARIWGLISDITRMHEWTPEDSRASWVDGATGLTVGARFKGSNRNGWRRWPTNCEVTACEPGRRFAFRVRSHIGPVAEWCYDIEVVDDTWSSVTETWIDQRRSYSVPIGRLVSGVSDREGHNKASMIKTLATLKNAAETR